MVVCVCVCVRVCLSVYKVSRVKGGGGSVGDEVESFWGSGVGCLVLGWDLGLEYVAGVVWRGVGPGLSRGIDA